MRTGVPIPGFPNYKACKNGKIWSENMKAFLKPFYNQKLYLRVKLFHEGQWERHFVHRLVAAAYCDNPDPKTHIQVNHNDFDKENNHFKNLFWVTPSMNMKHSRTKRWTPVPRQPSDPF